LLTALWGYLSDRVGRRQILMLLALLTIVSNGILIYFTSLFFILCAVIIANVGAGGSGGGGSGGGPFNPVEEALLAEKCQPENRNQIFAINSCVGSIMGSLGALASGLPQFLQEERSWSAVDSYKPLFILTIGFSIALLFVYRAITEHHQPRPAEQKMSKSTGVSECTSDRAQDRRCSHHGLLSRLGVADLALPALRADFGYCCRTDRDPFLLRVHG
jgi:MFS family permease